MGLNKNLNIAKKQKNDEFYTKFSDIENEVKFYGEQFAGKTVYCNCDDPFTSNFFKFFALNFNFLKLKKLIATCYAGSPDADNNLENQNQNIPHKIEITEIPKVNTKKSVNFSDVEFLLSVKNNHLTRLRGNGDFRSLECIELLEKADIVVTNPPFSLFREFVCLLTEFNKKFLIIGTDDCRVYAEIFPLIKENKMWCGYTRVKEFIQPDGSLKKFGKIGWYTNLDVKKRNEFLVLRYKYDQKIYPKYDNYDAIEVAKVAKIPMDFSGVMGVPVNFLDVYNPQQFEILGSNRGVNQDANKIYGRGTLINGKETFKRIFIKNKVMMPKIVGNLSKNIL